MLAKDPHAYMAYAAMIRREYHFVPQATYCSKRAEILKDMANQKSIFGSPAFASNDSWNAKARRNLQLELAMLQQGKIPA